MNMKAILREIQRREQVLKMDAETNRKAMRSTLAVMSECAQMHLQGFRTWLENYGKTAGDGRLKERSRKK